MKLYPGVFGVLIGAGLLATALAAQTPGMGSNAAVMFNTFDVNGDGTVTREEFNLRHQQRVQERVDAGKRLKNFGPANFDQFDGDGNGQLNRNEFNRMHQWRLEQKGMRSGGKQRGMKAQGTGQGRSQGNQQ